MKISKNVGRNCFSQLPSDVTLVQTALGSIKGKSFKAYYQGRIDGKCGPKTIAAIESFQCDQGLKVTGKFEQAGPGMNRLRSKTPMSVQNKLTNSGGGGAGAGGTLDSAKVIATNNLLAENILKKWALPKREAEGLAKCVRDVAKAGMVPLKVSTASPVTIDGAGRFTVKLEICPWGYGTGPQANAVKLQMIKRVSEIMGKSANWQKGAPETLEYKTMESISILADNNPPSEDFLTELGFSTQDVKDPIHIQLTKGLQSLTSKGIYNTPIYNTLMQVARGTGPKGDLLAKTIAKKKEGMFNGFKLYPIESLSISEKGISFIKGLEDTFKRDGLHILYDHDGGDNCTIGHGHLVHEGKCNGTEAEEFLKGISDQRAEELFRQDVGQRQKDLKKYLSQAKLTQPMFDASMSYYFNAGNQIKKFFKFLNDGLYLSAAKEIDIVTSGGKPASGLAKRRQLEIGLFLKGRY